MKTRRLIELTGTTAHQRRYLKNAMKGMTPGELRALLMAIFIALDPIARTVMAWEVFVIAGGYSLRETRRRR